MEIPHGAHLSPHHPAVDHPAVCPHGIVAHPQYQRRRSTHLSRFHLKKKSTATIPFSHAGHLKTSRRLQARSCKMYQGCLKLTIGAESAAGEVKGSVGVDVPGAECHGCCSLCCGRSDGVDVRGPKCHGCCSLCCGWAAIFRAGVGGSVGVDVPGAIFQRLVASGSQP